MKLSIIIPVFNEEKTILSIIKTLLKTKINADIEIIIVDDGSSDKTRNHLKKQKNKKLKIIRHDKNKGKGAAVRTGMEKATGEYILIQDADLEYNPKYINSLLAPIKTKKSEVVYGTRLKRLPNLNKEERTLQFLTHYLGNRFLSLVTSILYGQFITDMETGYKLFPKKALKGMRLNAKGFELEPEITAKLLRRGYKIVEVPINVNPRGYDEGKKINTLKDGTKALWFLFKYRFSD